MPKKKEKILNPKMLSSRIDLDDYLLFEAVLSKQNNGRRIKIQNVMYAFVRSCISGSIRLSDDGRAFMGKKRKTVKGEE